MEVEKHVEEFKQYISNTIKGYEQESWAIKQDWKYENLDLDEKIETINDALYFFLCNLLLLYKSWIR